LEQFRQAYGTQHIDTLRRGTYALITNDIRRIFGILSEIAQEVNTRSVSGERIDKLPEHYLAKKFQEFQQDRDVVSVATRNGIDLRNRDRFDVDIPIVKTQPSGNEMPPKSGSYDQRTATNNR
jgi:hypothetical protein